MILFERILGRGVVLLGRERRSCDGHLGGLVLDMKGFERETSDDCYVRILQAFPSAIRNLLAVKTFRQYCHCQLA